MCMQEDRETTFSLTSRKSYLGDRLSNQRKFLSRTFSYQPIVMGALYSVSLASSLFCERLGFYI